MTASPFNWLEASYFYYRPRDLIWEGTDRRGDYLDKGFNVKALYRPKNRNLPNIAIGMDDFAGTGYFTKEYIVASQNFKNFRYSLGMGWGKFSGENSFENPLNSISERLNTRPGISDNYQLGGAPSYDQWFRGDVGLFGGIEWIIPKTKGLVFKMEYDPFDYFDFSGGGRADAIYDIRKKESSLNFGFSYRVNKNLTLQSSFIKGNTFSFGFSFGGSFNGEGVKKDKFNPKISNTAKNTDLPWEERNSKDKKTFYVDLLRNLNSNKLWLQTAHLEDSNIDVVIMAEGHMNHIRSSSYAASMIKDIADNHKIKTHTINVSHMNEGVELNKVTYLANKVNSDNQIIEILKEYTEFSPGDKEKSLEHEFRPNLPLPMVFTSRSPVFLTHIGAPERFFSRGLAVKQTNQVLFRRNLILTSEIGLKISNNFRDSISGPQSDLPHVRSDIVQYLKGADQHIAKLHIDYLWSPKKELYAHLTAGIFEAMYGGVGVEILYKPFDKRYHVAFNLFEVRKRAFDQKFDFLDYQVSTGHLSFNYELWSGISADISCGRYLAKDDGCTFELSRETPSGFTSGVWVTLTDVPFELFGEGSFDKGFYWRIPFDLLSGGKYSGRRIDYKLRPLTRDGGQKLRFGKSLTGSMFNTNQLEFSNDWDGHLFLE